MGFEERAHAMYPTEVVDDTSAHTGDWFALQVNNEAVIGAITMPNCTNSDGYLVTLAAGAWIYGKITSVTLTSGVVTLFSRSAE